MESLKGFGRELGEGILGGLIWGVGIWVAALTSPIWIPAVVIISYKAYKADVPEGLRNRGLALERLEEVRLAKGEAAGGVLYFAEEGDLPATAATATLVVPIRDVTSGKERRVRLLLKNQREPRS